MTTQVELAPDVAEKLDREAAVSGQAPEDLVNAILRRELDITAAEAPAVDGTQGQGPGTLAELFAGRIGRVHGLSEPVARHASDRYSELLEEEYSRRRPSS